MNKRELRAVNLIEAPEKLYFIALLAFTVSLLSNQPDYFLNERWGLVALDSVTILMIYLSLLLYIKKRIGFNTNSAIFVYSTVINLSASIWYQYFNDFYFTGNFLFSTFIYSIYLVLAGFCIGRKHVYVVAAIYSISYLPLVFISKDPFLLFNGVIAAFLMVVYSIAVSSLLFLLDRSRKAEIKLKEEILEKDKEFVLEQNRFLNIQLEAKQREIMAKSMFLTEYAENNNDFINKLTNLKKNLSAADQRLLNEIIQGHSTGHFENTWKEFERTFLEIHPDFYKKLHAGCPSISPAELKLAALIKLGLSSKQIGNIAAIKAESVDVARSRLRNKLNLQGDSSLRRYLFNL
jgi:DNA-binding CsgD family transcriptional regulator